VPLTADDRGDHSVRRAVDDALDYFRGCLREGGHLAEDPNILYLHIWDSVNALKAIARWRTVSSRPTDDLVTPIGEFLRSCETPDGMVGWGSSEVGVDDYCTETSAEYVTALTLLGHRESARPKADHLRTRQLPGGHWSEVYPHIPPALQAVPSVTGFAFSALTGLGLEPVYPDEALDFLVRSQTEQGHFGINAYYCATYFYILRPVVAVLAEFGHYAAVARARDFVLRVQRDDGSWFSTTEGYEAFSTPELHTALALEVLAHTGLPADHRAISRGASWLLERQRADGSWDGGFYAMPSTNNYRELQRPQTVYTTAQVLSTLHHLTSLETRHATER
jgi:hypothetical protein